MEIINSSWEKQQFNLTSICDAMVGMFKDMGLVLIRRTKHQNKEELLLGSRAPFPKSKQAGEVIWEVWPAKKAIKVRLKLSGAEGSSNWGLTCCLRQNWEEVSQFVYQVNNLKLKSSEGFFYLQEQTGQVGFQSKINGIQFITTPQKLLTVIRAKLHLYLSIFLQELEIMIFYFRIPGFSLHQYQAHLQPNNFIPLKRQIEKITSYREYFQRKHTYPNPYWSFHPQHLTQSFKVLYGSNLNFQGLNAQSGFSSNEMLSRLEYDFEQQRNLLMNDLEKYQTQGFDPILTAIEIKQKTKEKMIDSGGFSQIFSGIYSFIPQLSIHKSVNTMIDTRSYLKTGYHLVKKKGNQKKVEPALKNQFNFLYYMRNKVCPYFAKYYCNNTIMPFSDGEVYLQYYPCSLADCHLSEKQKIKVMEDICMGLLFLSQEGIIHRDLKELNIMIDKRKRGRLIDFGSVSSTVGNNRFKPIDDKIRSTEGYFLPYSQATKQFPSLLNKISKQDYYNHRSFDQYGLGKIIHNEFFLDHVINQSHFFRYNLHYLVAKCQEINPEERLTLEEVTIFVRQLMLFNVFRNEFWKIGFDEKCRPHIFGCLQGEREMKASDTAVDPPK